MRMRGAKAIFTIALLGLIVPMQMTLVPLTILYQQIGPDRQPARPVLPLSRLRTADRHPVLRGFFRSIPNELIEAAFIDGCSWWGVYWRIVMPLAKPALVSLLILDGISTWNEFILAQIFLRTQSQRTLPLGVVHVQQASSRRSTKLLAAGQIITIVPLARCSTCSSSDTSSTAWPER